MALLNRNEFVKSLEESREPPSGQLFFFFGERYLCKNTADILQQKLGHPEAATVTPIDGDEEDPGRTLARLQSLSLLPGKQIFRINDTRLFHSKEVVSTLWEKALAAKDAGKENVTKKNLLALAAAVGLTVEGQSPLSEISEGEWQKRFGFAKPPGDLGWADFILFAERAKLATSSRNVADLYLDAFAKGLPTKNLVILTAETVDKRKKLFVQLKKLATVVDCSVATGASSAAQGKQQEVLHEILQSTLKEFAKKIEKPAIEELISRTGFHPVAVALETEKLCHYVGSREQIRALDVTQVVVRNREDALFELTEAFANRQAGRSLVIMGRLLDRGLHALAILSTLRNYCRRLLIFRHLQLTFEPQWRRGMRAAEFQNSYLPALKASGQWTDLLGAHPFALYRTFSKASEFSCQGLQRWLGMVLDAEYRLKGSGLSDRLVLEELVLAMLRGKPRRTFRDQS